MEIESMNPFLQLSFANFKIFTWIYPFFYYEFEIDEVEFSNSPNTKS